MPSLLRKARFKVLSLILTRLSIYTSELLDSQDLFKTHLCHSDQELYLSKTDDDTANEYFKSLFTSYTVKGHFVGEIHDCFLLTSRAIPVTKNGRVIVETSGHIGMLIINILDEPTRILFPEIPFLVKIALIYLSNIFSIQLTSVPKIDDPVLHMVPRHGSSSNSPIFSHWIFENLPQLYHYDFIRTISPNIQILIGSTLTEYQSITLSLLRIGSSRIRLYDSKFVRVNTLFITRLPYIHSNTVISDPIARRWVSQRLRESLLSTTHLPYPKINRLVLSRKYCSRRILINEPKYKHQLHSLGFASLYPEKTGEIDKYFSCLHVTTALCLPSGSAFANLIFAPSSTQIIEVLPDDPTCFFSVFFLLSQDLGFSYNLILADNVGFEHDYRANNMAARSNFISDLRSRLENPTPQ